MVEAYNAKIISRLHTLMGPKREIDITSHEYMKDMSIALINEYKANLERLFQERELNQFNRDRLREDETSLKPKTKSIFYEDSDDEWVPYYSEESDEDEVKETTTDSKEAEKTEDVEEEEDEDFSDNEPLDVEYDMTYDGTSMSSVKGSDEDEDYDEEERKQSYKMKLKGSDTQESIDKKKIANNKRSPKGKLSPESDKEADKPADKLHHVKFQNNKATDEKEIKGKGEKKSEVNNKYVERHGKSNYYKTKYHDIRKSIQRSLILTDPDIKTKRNHYNKSKATAMKYLEPQKSESEVNDTNSDEDESPVESTEDDSLTESLIDQFGRRSLLHDVGEEEEETSTSFESEGSADGIGSCAAFLGRFKKKEKKDEEEELKDIASGPTDAKPPNIYYDMVYDGTSMYSAKLKEQQRAELEDLQRFRDNIQKYRNTILSRMRMKMADRAQDVDKPLTIYQDLMYDTISLASTQSDDYDVQQFSAIFSNPQIFKKYKTLLVKKMNYSLPMEELFGLCNEAVNPDGKLSAKYVTNRFNEAEEEDEEEETDEEEDFNQ